MKLHIKEDYEDNVTIQNIIDNLTNIFHKYFPNENINIEYVHNIRNDNLWITALGYGKYNNNTDINNNVSDVINFSATVYFSTKYDNDTDIIGYNNNLAIVPSGVIYLPKSEGSSYEHIIGSGRTTKGNIDKILNKFDIFCRNCKTTYKKYYH